MKPCQRHLRSPNQKQIVSFRVVIGFRIHGINLVTVRREKTGGIHHLFLHQHGHGDWREAVFSELFQQPLDQREFHQDQLVLQIVESRPTGLGTSFHVDQIAELPQCQVIPRLEVKLGNVAHGLNHLVIFIIGPLGNGLIGWVGSLVC